MRLLWLLYLIHISCGTSISTRMSWSSLVIVLIIIIFIILVFRKRGCLYICIRIRSEPNTCRIIFPFAWKKEMHIIWNLFDQDFFRILQNKYCIYLPTEDGVDAPTRGKHQKSGRVEWRAALSSLPPWSWHSWPSSDAIPWGRRRWPSRTSSSTTSSPATSRRASS